MSYEAEEHAWAAGLFDGEGSIGVYESHPSRFTLQTRLNMCHEKTVRRFKQIVGLGTIRKVKVARPRRDYWAWRVNGPDAVYVLEMLVGHLTTKKEQALCVLNWPDVDKRAVAKRVKALKRIS